MTVDDMCINQVCQREDKKGGQEMSSGISKCKSRLSGTIIAGCREWFRPVIFKVERMEDD